MASSALKTIMLNPEETKALKLCKKKRKITCREVDWWTLDSMVHKTVLDKVVPKRGRDQGWAYFKLSHRGKKYLENLRKREQEANRR